MLKKIFKVLIIYFIITIFILLNNVVNSASMGISINKSSATVGDSFSVTISGIYGKVTVSGNSNVTLSQTGSVFVDGSLTISGTAKSEGTGTITVTAVDVVTTGSTPEEVSGSQSKSITIKKKETTTTQSSSNKNNTTTSSKKNTTSNSSTSTSSNSSSSKTTTTTKKTETKEKEEATAKWGINEVKLIGIKENGEKIDLELDKKFNISTYEYSCDIPSDIKKIEVEKEAYEYNEYVTITGLEEDLQDGENTIILKLAKDGQKELNYVFKINKKIDEEETEIINEEPQEEKAEEKNNFLQESITLPIWLFVLMELAIIVGSVGITMLVMKRNSSKEKNDLF